MPTNPADTCLYFVRSCLNGRVTEWVSLPNVGNENLIRSHELQAATRHLSHVDSAPSYWKVNGAYAITPMSAVGHTPPQTYAILKLPVALVLGLTADQALDIVRCIEPNIIKNFAWSSTDLHSIARINHLPLNPSAARGFYRNGMGFFRRLATFTTGNKLEDTLGHQFDVLAQAEPPKRAVTQDFAHVVRRRSASNDDSMASPGFSRPIAAVTPPKRSRVGDLHRRMGLKGGHPDPRFYKMLKGKKAADGKPAPDTDTSPQSDGTGPLDQLAQGKIQKFQPV